jgi:TPR repeat protein
MKPNHSKIILLLIVLVSLLSQGFLSTFRAQFYADSGDSLLAEKKYSEALEKYKSAAELESGYAYYRLFNLYFEGEGTPKDLPLAKEMLEKAVHYEYDEAQVTYAGILFIEGKEKDKAITLLKMAAEKENVLAYIKLALIYYYGNGVPKDLIKAEEYKRLANAHGYNMSLVPKKINTPSPKKISTKEITAKIQENLKKLGFYQGSVDGITGAKTRQSIANFQKSRGLQKDTAISQEVLEQTQEALKP